MSEPGRPPMADWADNPFFVLDVPTTATRAEIERAGQKWLGMLTLGLARAAVYVTPLGVRARTPELVRAAMAELRDPERRVGHELWCLLDEAPPVVEADVEDLGEAGAGFDALGAAGWRR